MSKQAVKKEIGKYIAILGILVIIAGILLVGRGMYIKSNPIVHAQKIGENDDVVIVPETEEIQNEDGAVDKGIVNIKYVDENGREIATADMYQGEIGTEYNFERKEIEGYTTNGTEPINKKGIYTKDTILVVFVYRDLKDTVIIDSEEKTVTVQVLNDKQSETYDFEIRTKSIRGEDLSGAGYRVTDETGNVIRDTVSTTSKYVIGALTINNEGKQTFNIEQTTYPDRYKAQIENINPISIIAEINTGAKEGESIYNLTFEYEPQEGLNVYLENSTVVIEIVNQDRQYSNLILKYVDEENNEIKESETMEGEVGIEYSIPEIKEFDGYRFVEIEGETSGIYGEQDTIVVYKYNKIKYGNLIVNYLDEEGNKLATEEKTTEEVGTTYSIPATREFDGYDLVSIEGNIEGTYTEEDIIVTYKYNKIKWGNLILRYIDEENNQIALEEKTTEKVGTAYSIPLTKEIEGYEFVEVEGNTEGTYTEGDIIVTYKYNRIKIIGSVIVKYQDREGNDIAETEISSAEVGTEFNLPREGKKIDSYVYVGFEGIVKGIYTEEDIIIIYKYEKEKEYGNVIVKYIDEDGNVLELDNYKAEIGTEYSFDEIGKEIDGYNFVSFEGALKGTHQSEDIVIIYKYNRIKEYGRIILKYVDVEGNEITEDINGDEVIFDIITSEIDTKYKMSSIGKEILGYEFTSVEGSLEGVFLQDDIVIVYKYEKVKIYGNLIINYIDENGNPIAIQEKMTQEVGTAYSLPASKEFPGFEFKGVDGLLDGIYTEEDIVITYKYQKNKETGKIIIKYINENNEEIADSETSSAEIGTKYILSENGKQIDGYTFVSVEGNVNGEYTVEDITVIYKYQKIVEPENPVPEKRNIFIEYKDENGNEISETEKRTLFEGAYYKLDEIGKTIKGYTFKEVKGNLDGTLGKEDVTITYIYKKDEDIIFNLELNKTIKNVKIIEGTSVQEKTIKAGDKMVKIEIPAKQIDYSTVRVTYDIEVKNTGNLEGYAKKIVDYLPNNFTYVDEKITNWKVNGNKLETEDLKDVLIKPGESKTLSVTLDWKLQGTDLGSRINMAEITEYANSKDLKINTDDNKDKATIIVGVSTGAISYVLQFSGAVLILIGIAIAVKRTKEN